MSEEGLATHINKYILQDYYTGAQSSRWKEAQKMNCCTEDCSVCQGFPGIFCSDFLCCALTQMLLFVLHGFKYFSLNATSVPCCSSPWAPVSYSPHLVSQMIIRKGSQDCVKILQVNLYFISVAKIGMGVDVVQQGCSFTMVFLTWCPCLLSCL